jgi:hypothetical protein
MSTLERPTLTDPEFNYPIRVVLENDMNNILRWDKLCSDAIMLFGLPGDRYITDIGGACMDWIFRDPKDALLFRLRFSEVTTNVTTEKKSISRI